MGGTQKDLWIIGAVYVNGCDMHQGREIMYNLQVDRFVQEMSPSELLSE